jgi:tetratricopeptide (TPR) repeat protein
MPGKIMTALTRIEADNLWSKGRLLDAKRIYSDLIASSPHMTLNTRANLETRIRLLQAEIDRPVSDTNAGDIARDIDEAIKKLQKALAKDRSIEDLRKGAKTFFSKGLYADALECLKGLVRQNAADEFCVRATAECITRQHTIEDIPVAVDLFLVEAFHNAEKAALFKMMLAEKMDQIGYASQSKVLQHHADRFITY